MPKVSTLRPEIRQLLLEGVEWNSELIDRLCTDHGVARQTVFNFKSKLLKRLAAEQASGDAAVAEPAEPAAPEPETVAPAEVVATAVPMVAESGEASNGNGHKASDEASGPLETLLGWEQQLAAGERLPGVMTLSRAWAKAERAGADLSVVPLLKAKLTKMGALGGQGSSTLFGNGTAKAGGKAQAGTLSPDHRAYIQGRGYTEAQIDWLVAGGFLRSLTWEQVRDQWRFTRAKATQTGGILICWNPKAKQPHYSLRCDDPPMDEERGRADKYLFQTGGGEHLAVWDPSGLVGPDGEVIGRAEISTEGFFDAVCSTLVLGIPCVAITAPSHLRRLTLPERLKVYLGDCDQWMAQDLLPSLVRGCVATGLRLGRLPLREQHREAYLGPHAELPGAAKGGMEELVTDHGVEGARSVVMALRQTARQPGDYLAWEIGELQELGIRWPGHAVPIQNLISAMADAHPDNAPKRDALKATIVAAFPPLGAKTVNDGIRGRLERRRQAEMEERRQQLEQEREAALARGEKVKPLIDKEEPTSLQLQEWMAYAHTIRWNELTRLPEMDGNPLTDLKLVYQLMASLHGIEAGKAQAADALVFVAKTNPYNPIAAYLERLRDDDAIEPMALAEVAELFGLARGDSISAELLQRGLAGTAKRGLEPGCKFDQVPILRSTRQGLGKTEALRELASESWSDTLGKIDQRESLSGWKVTSKLARCWILELGEVDQLTRGRCASELKDWATIRVDKYAEKNEQLTTEHPRRCVPWGTTNEEELLNDATGSRRFWIIEVVNLIDWKRVGRERDRIWKAALGWLDAGTETWLNPDTEEGAALLAATADRGLAATFSDPWASAIADYLEAVLEAHAGITVERRAELARTGFWETAHPTGGAIHTVKVRYQSRGHRDSGLLALFVTVGDLHDALDVKVASRDKGTSARIGKAMQDHAITSRGWGRGKSKRAGERGFLLGLGDDDSDGGISVPILGGDSPLGSDSGIAPETPTGARDLGSVPILLGENTTTYGEHLCSKGVADTHTNPVMQGHKSAGRIGTEPEPLSGNGSGVQFENGNRAERACSGYSLPLPEGVGLPHEALVTPGKAYPLVLDLETASSAELWRTPDPERPFVRLVGTDHGINTDPGQLLDHPGPLVAHNGFGFDFLALAHHHGLDLLGLSEAGRLIDTMVLEALAHPNADDLKPEQYLKQLGLDAAAERRGLPGKTDSLGSLALEAAKAAGLEGTPTELKAAGFELIPQGDPRYASYLRGDVVATRAVLEAQCPGGQLTPYQQREMRLMGRLAHGITLVGFRIDRPEIEAREASRQQRIAGTVARLETIGLPPRTQGKDGKWSTPHATAAGKAAIAKAFADHGIILPTTPRSGQPQIKADGLLAIAKANPYNPALVALAEDVADLVGSRSTYGNVLRYAAGDRVHPTVFPGQATGRCSIKDPGLTVLGKNGDKAVEREVFLPDADDHVLLAIDLSKADARAVAVWSQDQRYLDLFDAGVDINAALAGQFGISKQLAKALGHGTRYNQQARGMHNQTGIPLPECEAFIQRHRERHPGVHRWIDRVVQIGKSGRPLQNGFGRLLYTGRHTSGPRRGESQAFTQAPAYLGQSTTREWMAEGILRLPLEIAAQVRCFLHDEIVLSVPERHLDLYREALLEAFQFRWTPPEATMVISTPSGIIRPVPVVAELSAAGKTWADCYREES